MIINEHLSYNHITFKTPSIEPQEFSFKSLSCYKLIFVKKGTVHCVVEGKKFKLKKNDLLLIRPSQYHYLKVLDENEFDRFSLLFDSTILDKSLLDSIPHNLNVLNCPSGSIICDIFEKIDYYFNALEKEALIDLLPAIIKELIYAILLSQDKAVDIPSEISPLLTKALNYINTNLFTIQSIKEVAEMLFVTEQYFFKVFQSQLKTTPKKYINIKRLLHAQKLLQRGKKPVEIYLQCGFDSYVGFYKQYLKTFGYPPSKEKTLLVKQKP
jgi:AraC-like DNA-binding protein